MDKHCDSIHYETLWIMDLQSYTTESNNSEKVQILLLCLIQIFYNQKGENRTGLCIQNRTMYTHASGSGHTECRTDYTGNKAKTANKTPDTHKIFFKTGIKNQKLVL